MVAHTNKQQCVTTMYWPAMQVHSRTNGKRPLLLAAIKIAHVNALNRGNTTQLNAQAHSNEVGNVDWLLRHTAADKC